MEKFSLFSLFQRTNPRLEDLFNAIRKNILEKTLLGA